MKWPSQRYSTTAILVLISASLCIQVCESWTRRTRSEFRNRNARYTKFDPPRIHPIDDFQTVKAGDTYTFSCEGNGRGVSWRLPDSAQDGLRQRIDLAFEEQPSSVYVAKMTVKNLVYSDTGTFTCSFNGTTDISSIDNSTNFHLYVDDGVHLLKSTGYEFFQAVQSSAFTLPCMPTHPDVNVTLWKDGGGGSQLFTDSYISYDPKVGFRISPVVMKLHSGEFSCHANYKGRKDILTANIRVLTKTSYVPMPYINQSLARHVRIGDSFTLTCSVTVEFNVMVRITWKTPNVKAVEDERLIIPDSISKNLSLAPGANYKQVEQALTVRRATKNDQGLYECTVEDHSGNKQTKREYLRVMEEAESYIRIYFDAYQTLDVTLGREEKKPVRWVVQINAHPQPIVEWYDPNGAKIDNSNQDFEVKTTYGRHIKTMLTINRVNLSKTGNYTVHVFNANESQTENFTLIVRSEPRIQVGVLHPQELYQLGAEYTLKCSAKGYPRPSVRWLFKPCTSYVDCDNGDSNKLKPAHEEKTFSSYGLDSVLKTVAHKSGHYICQACNNIGCQFETVPFFVTDIDADGGFSIDGPKHVLVGDPMTLRCSASIYNYTEGSIEWYKHSLQGETLLMNSAFVTMKETSNEWSFTKEAVFSSVSLGDKGRYVCKVKERKYSYQSTAAAASAEQLQQRRSYYDFVNGERPTHTLASTAADAAYSGTFDKEMPFHVNVLPLEEPEFRETNLSEDEPLVVHDPNTGLDLVCRVDGRPRPEVKWLLHGVPLRLVANMTRIQIVEEGQVLRINYVLAEDEGLYECRAENRAGVARHSRVIQLFSSAEKDALYANISLPVIIVVVVALLLVALLVAFAKWFYHRRDSTWKEPPTPPTPRLMQYELPQNQEEDSDECTRMTLASSSICRDGSISPMMSGGGHLVSACQDPCHCHVHQACHLGPSVLVSKCTLCDYSMQTLPLNRMATLRRYDTYRSQSHSPRQSAEF